MIYIHRRLWWSWPYCRAVSYKIKVFLYVRAWRKSFIGKEDRRNCSTLKYSYRLPRGRLSDHGSENKWERFFLVSPLLYSLGYYPTTDPMVYIGYVLLPNELLLPSPPLILFSFLRSMFLNNKFYSHYTNNPFFFFGKYPPIPFQFKIKINHDIFGWQKDSFEVTFEFLFL